MSTPDSNRARNTLVAMAGAVGASIPVVGTGVAALMGAVSAAQRERDEEFFARVVATGKMTEERVEAIASGDEPQFVATVFRVVREAQTTIDRERLDVLARILSNAGSWSSVPADDREELVGIAISLSARQVRVLDFLDDVRGWVRRNPSRPWPEHGGGPNTRKQALKYFLAGIHDETEHVRLLEATAHLERAGLVEPGALDTYVTAGQPVVKVTTDLGGRVLTLLRA